MLTYIGFKMLLASHGRIFSCFLLVLLTGRFADGTPTVEINYQWSATYSSEAIAASQSTFVMS
jgi:hypothetical protein